MEQIINEITINTISDKKGKALTSFILGIVSTVAWFIPIIGAPVTIVGLIMGILGRKSSRKWMAIVGIVLCSIFLIATVVNGVLGAIIAVDKMNEILRNN